MMRRIPATPIALALALALSPVIPGAASQPTQAQPPQQAGQPEHGRKPGMDKPGMHASCEAMMARHQKMMDEMNAMDARLDALGEKMNSAQGQAKIDATATVVNELVQQRKTMRDRMMMMHHGMVGHMMGHMAEGKESMAACPMMKMMHDQEGR